MTFLLYLVPVAALAVLVSLVLKDRPARGGGVPRGTDPSVPREDRVVQEHRFRPGGFRTHKAPRSSGSIRRARARRGAKRKMEAHRRGVELLCYDLPLEARRAVKILGTDDVPMPGDLIRLTRGGTNHYLRAADPTRTLCGIRVDGTMDAGERRLCVQCKDIELAWRVLNP